MAIFKIAEEITGRNEGGYANNSADRGGETYAGIARNFWGSWKGWKYIDKYKDDYQKSNKKLSLASWINASAKVETEPVQDLVSDFYKVNFWDSMKLDFVNDQQLANSVYDFAVNSGVVRASKYLQQAINEVCNVNLSVDGVIGNKTISEINKHSAMLIYNLYNKKRETFYRSIAKGNQAQFLKSWLSRLKPYK